MAMKIIVIGGSAAGPKAAAKARRLDEAAEITILQKAPDLSMASCGYPYYVGGFFDDRNMLLCTPTGVVRDPKFYLNAKGINARNRVEALAIDRQAKTVRVRCLETGNEEVLPYDKLILATGAQPKMPPIPGIELEGITTLQSMQDADFLRAVSQQKKITKAVVIGGGLIGIETCEALQEIALKPHNVFPARKYTHHTETSRIYKVEWQGRMLSFRAVRHFPGPFRQGFARSLIILPAQQGSRKSRQVRPVSARLRPL